MSRLLLAASILWLVVLGSAAVGASSGRATTWSALVYAAASRVCHQRPERSFHLDHAQWPVCARCAGLYLAAPLGALAVVLWRRRQSASPAAVVVVSAIPTVATLLVEWAGLSPLNNPIRFTAALPLGAAITYAIGVAVGPTEGAPRLQPRGEPRG